MKNMVTLTAVFAVASIANVHAQSNPTPGALPQQSAQISAESPANPGGALTFSPQVSTGVRSYLSGKYTGNSANNNSVGPYVTPAFDLGYKQPKFNLGLNYELETSGAQGFGKGNETKKFSENLYFMHHPVITASGGLSDTTKLNAIADISFTMNNGKNQKENQSVIAFLPEIEQKMNSTMSIAVGYWLDRSENYDSTIGFAEADGSTKGINAATNTKDFYKALNAANPNLGVTPTQTINSGFVRAKFKLPDGVSVNTYVKAGRSHAVAAETTDSYVYRWNTDMAVNATEALSLSLRYRLQVSDPSGVKPITMLNRGRLIASYTLNDNWSLDLTNTFDHVKVNSKKAGATYMNENYVGTTVKF